MGKYVTMCGLKWSVSYKEMSIYKGSFLPIITYTAYAWIDNVVAAPLISSCYHATVLELWA